MTMPRISEAAPACVILIRHAQKTGIPGDRDLSDLGLERGKALLSRVVQIVPEIDAIIAAKSSRKSRRPWLTVEPLAIDIGLTIAETWNTQDYGALALELLTSGRYRDQNVLICWRHDTLQALALALGVPEAPPWGQELYDIIWLLDMTGTEVLFHEIPA